ncbi:hypothetical protein PF006_g7423 [Phytophthora fragariae]|uniref:Uncharacterized protein n=1 Tax=Phytophthora fragariae TaxID=53985 RepID=A0A6A3U9M2_9STRA|nr:hypothetical protein PF006_g7423 [Phytophthora fragariae]KAE9358539.1 hypothetical protein PF008_g2645 [Phytophthora fragariae]
MHFRSLKFPAKTLLSVIAASSSTANLRAAGAGYQYGGRTSSLGALQDRQRTAAFEVQECPLSILRSTPHPDLAVTAPQEAHHDL